MCDFPLTIKNPRYGVYIGESKCIQVPCGKCVACYNKRAKNWFVRLHYQNRISNSSHFVTLTYELPRRTFNGYFTAFKPDLQKFFKRLRKREIGNNEIKYYAVSEYGTKNQRPHYHIILFNVRDENNIVRAWSGADEFKPVDDIGEALPGSVDIGNVQPASIMYVTGYIGKRIGIPLDDDDDRTPEFSLMSKNIGTSFLDEASNFNVNHEVGYTIINGITYSLPRYYKEKIWKPTIIEHPAQLKPLIKFSNPILKRVSKKNQDAFIQNQNQFALHFASFSDFERNQREFAKFRNQNISTIINSKI